MINNLNILLPEIFLTLSIFSILMIGVFLKNSFNLVFNLSSIIIIITITIIINRPYVEEKIFLDSFTRDAFSNFFKILILISSLFVLNTSKNYIIDKNLDIRAGDKVLIDCATGGVGVFALQMIKDAGATAIGLTSSPTKKEFIMEYGAKAYTHEEFESSGEKDFDFILNSRGGASLKAQYNILGNFLVYGALVYKGYRLEQEFYVFLDHRLDQS